MNLGFAEGVYGQPIPVLAARPPSSSAEATNQRMPLRAATCVRGLEYRAFASGPRRVHQMKGPIYTQAGHCALAAAPFDSACLAQQSSFCGARFSGDRAGTPGCAFDGSPPGECFPSGAAWHADDICAPALPAVEARLWITAIASVQKSLCCAYQLLHRANQALARYRLRSSCDAGYPAQRRKGKGQYYVEEFENNEVGANHEKARYAPVKVVPSSPVKARAQCKPKECQCANEKS